METKAELFAALAKAQAEMPVVEKKSSLAHLKRKYADLASIVQVTMPILTKHGLCITQFFEVKEGETYLTTILGHTSGQNISSSIKIEPEKDGIQGFGSALTYLRRYSYTSIAGIVTAEEDDDGEAAMRKNTSDPRQSDKISIDQLEQLTAELEMVPELIQDICMKLKIGKLADIPRSHFMPVLNRVREIKALKRK